MPKRKEQIEAARVTVRVGVPFLAGTLSVDALSNLECGQISAEEFASVFPILLAEAAASTTVVYDASSFTRPDDAVEALIAGSATLAALMNQYYSKHNGRAKLYLPLVVALVEAHKHKPEPVASFGNGVVNEYGRKLFGSEALAFNIYRKEGWTIWDNSSKVPREYFLKEQSADGKWWHLVPLGCSRKVLSRLRVRLSSRPLGCAQDE